MAPGPGFNPVSFFGGVRVAHRFSFLCCVIFVFVLCAQCCQCLWIALLETKSIPLAHIYTTAQFPGLVRHFDNKCRG
jgi:hypothetical protein